MSVFDIIKTRRSIRRYQNKPVEHEKLEMILEAGLYAPNPGGRQGTKIIMLTKPDIIDKIGVINANCENRNWGGSGVSRDQPSIIDDISIKSGFYGCPALAVICVPKNMRAKVNCIGSAFVCAQNIVLEAHELGVSSCIVGRAEATFEYEENKALLREWGLDEEYTPMVFVCLGYIDGNYPEIKPRAEGRAIYI